jgi:hypothetical protein
MATNQILFERKLRERTDGTLIESRCKYCGQILLGKAIFGDLLEQEQQHTDQCVREHGKENELLGSSPKELNHAIGK